MFTLDELAELEELAVRSFLRFGATKAQCFS